MTTRDTSGRIPEPIQALRLRDPAGVVAAVPYLLGFVPVRSLVVVGVGGDRSVGPTLRCDWTPEQSAGLPSTWAHVEQVMGRNGCTSALVLVYGDTDPEDLRPGWDEALLDTVTGPGSRPLEVLDLLVVGPGRFRSLLCTDPSCCPATGAPLSQASAHPVAVSFVLAGCSPAADRDSVEPPVRTAADDHDRARRAARSARARPMDEADLLHRWSSCLPEGPDPELAGPLAAAWRARPRLRDACLAVLLPGGTELSGHILRPGPGAKAGSGLADQLLDPACARATRTGTPVLRRLASMVTGHDRAVVLASHAWLCWVAGEGPPAAVLAERAVAEDPDQSLAALVLQCLSNGVGAPWTMSYRSRPAPAARGYQDGDGPAPGVVDGGWW